MIYIPRIIAGVIVAALIIGPAAYIIVNMAIVGVVTQVVAR